MDFHIDLANIKINNEKLENIIYLGDFNYVTDKIDRNNQESKYDRKSTIQKWKIFQATHDLKDTFRDKHPDLRRYTYTHKNKKGRSRLDRIYVSENLFLKVKNTKFNETHTQDHKMVETNFHEDITNGPGLWCFRNTLLKDKDFVEIMSEEIKNFVKQLPDYKDKFEFWEEFYVLVRVTTQEYSKEKNKNFKNEMVKVTTEINNIEKIDPRELSDEHLKRLSELKIKEQKLLKYQADGLRELIKFPIVEEKEADISYLTKLYKKRICENNIYALRTDEKSPLREDTDGKMEIIEDFYKKLYTKEETCEISQNRLLNNIRVKLTDEQREYLDKFIDENELHKALRDSPTNKSPGLNGLTKEFLEFFWNEIKAAYMEVFREILTKKELSETMKIAAVRILYKKGDSTLMKNYRPISLINVDVKIIAKVLATRMTKVLPDIIHNNQKCIPGRHIVNNIHVVNDLIRRIQENGEGAALIFLDQEKAFGRVDHSFLIKTLEAFGFGPHFIEWIKILYNNIQSVIKLNGFISTMIEIERGVRQGCPLSALLYILIAEVLGIEVRLNDKIVGYKFRDQEHKILQYADDTCLCVTVTESIKECFNVLTIYEKASGAKVNISKTDGMWIGTWSKRINDESFKNFAGLTWTDEDLKFLGEYIGEDLDKLQINNIENTVQDMTKSLHFWKGKYLSKKGTIRVINTYVLSKMFYDTETQTPTDDQIEHIESEIKKVYWKNSQPNIRLDNLKMDYDEGGLNLTDINSKYGAQRVKWLLESKNLSHDTIENFLVDEGLGYYKDENITIKGFDLLKYRVNRPID